VRRRTYLSTVASGTALAVAGCTGGDDTDDSEDPDEGSDGNTSDGDQNNSSDGETGDSQQLDEPLDVLVENDYGETYTVEVVVTDDSDETVFEDEAELETGASNRFEDVVSEPGTYTVEATKAGSISRSFDWEVDADAQDVYVHIAESGDYTVEERDVDA